MTGRFPMVPLGVVLTKSEEWIDLAPDQRYRELTVRLWGKGVVQRREVSGADIAARKRLVVRSQQFILSRIDARNGAFGLVPDSLDGAVVSNDFPVFIPNRLRILPTFLHWMSKTAWFVDLCKAASEGTTNRVRLVEDRFLATEIPLPSLEEQRLIVAQIEELAAKIEQAHALRQTAQREAEALYVSQYRSLFSEDGKVRWQHLTVEECCDLIIDYRGRTPPLTDAGIPHITSANIRNGRIDWQTSKFVSEDTYNRYMTRGIPLVGDVLFTMEAPLGEAAVIQEYRKFSLAQRTLLLRGRSGLVTGGFLARVLTSPDVREAIYAYATGTTVKGVASKRLKKVVLPIPALDEQRRILAYLDDLQAKVDALKWLQAETAAELDALLPSILDKAFKGEL